MENYTMEGRTYRYYGPEAPLYPFGYGLSYTTFLYRDLVLSPTALPLCANLSVSVVVENTGQRDGEEVRALPAPDQWGVGKGGVEGGACEAGHGLGEWDCRMGPVPGQHLVLVAPPLWGRGHRGWRPADSCGFGVRQSRGSASASVSGCL